MEMTHMQVKYIEKDKYTYEVCIYKADPKEYEDYGTIEYDDAQGAWIVWIKELDDGITYCATLKETEKYLSEKMQGREKLIQQHFI